ncbi:glycosyltransferase [Legionella sp. CNM-1927-20]|uniref:glycosyltransferase n=1 Tax=Legionella sp. CNM-1927-20 TaxID=3422221 RepID=UPI00403B2AA8
MMINRDIISCAIKFLLLCAPSIAHCQTEFPSVTSYSINPYTYNILSLIILIPLFLILFILGIYAVRHYALSFNRLFGYQRNLYAEIMECRWPTVTILIPAHNEENVIEYLLSALVDTDYPKEKIQVIVINDRSTDTTGDIVATYVDKCPNLFTLINRTEGTAGKSAALKHIMDLVTGDITVVFDADNKPGRFFLKNILTPFIDPEVGSVMGRAMPGNPEVNLLTRLLEMERSGGYQVNQQARENLIGVPQYGGTAGGIRTQALREVGGWDERFLAEDTEITFRLLESGWKTIYQNNAECFELVPDAWPVRISQISRWAKGHNQVLAHHFLKTIFGRNLTLVQRLDGLLLLFLYLVSPLLFIGWLLFILAYYLDIVPGASTILGFLIIISFSGAGNFTIFHEISTGIFLDNLRNIRANRMRLLPFSYFNFFVSLIVLTKVFIKQITVDLFKKDIVWVRTEHNYSKNKKKS